MEQLTDGSVTQISGRVGVIGDLIESRGAPVRSALQNQLEQALELANGLVPAVDTLVVTIGDEFQGLYRTVDEALAATLIIQLALGYESVRIGIGTGSLSFYSRARVPFGQDGPVWWAARAAIANVHSMSERRRAAFMTARPPRGRTVVEHEPDSLGWRQLQFAGMDDDLPPERPDVFYDKPAMVNSLLLYRDAALARLDERDRAIGLGLILGRTQQQIGAEVGISQPAVSQRVSRSGLDLVVAGFDVLSGVLR
ncbi:MAG: hypothetical protein GY925_14730 [Actinomycetia bacterium]|nr:hypothetical protein [bacterium]MCP4960509.1 hypothetical protein [Actinomycetes bacterium]